LHLQAMRTLKVALSKQVLSTKIDPNVCTNFMCLLPPYVAFQLTNIHREHSLVM